MRDRVASISLIASFLLEVVATSGNDIEENDTATIISSTTNPASRSSFLFLGIIIVLLQHDKSWLNFVLKFTTTWQLEKAQLTGPHVLNKLV